MNNKLVGVRNNYQKQFKKRLNKSWIKGCPRELEKINIFINWSNGRINQHKSPSRE